jgi:hypothetical protein
MIPGEMPVTARYASPSVLRWLAEARQIAEEARGVAAIPNTRYEQFKMRVSGALRETHENWQKAYLQLPHGYLREMGNEVYYSSSLGIHNITAWVTKANKVVAIFHAPAIYKDVRDIFVEFVPWNQVLTELKGKAAKRGDARLAAPTPRVPVNPDQIRATCSCCFRQVAVVRGGKGMAHHGYQRPERGWQTRSCMGVSYPPYELSNNGTKAFKQALIASAEDNERRHARLSAHEEPVRERNSGSVLQSDHANYEPRRRSMMFDAQQQSEGLRRMAAELEPKINSWQRIPVAGLTNA